MPDREASWPPHKPEEKKEKASIPNIRDDWIRSRASGLYTIGHAVYGQKSLDERSARRPDKQVDTNHVATLFISAPYRMSSHAAAARLTNRTSFTEADIRNIDDPGLQAFSKPSRFHRLYIKRGWPSLFDMHNVRNTVQWELGRPS